MLAKVISVALAACALVYGAPAVLDKRLSAAGNPVVIDGAGIYIRANRMNDGSIIAGYASGEGSQKVLETARSTNSGQSWTHLGEVFRADYATVDLDNAMPIQLPSGRVLYAYRNHDKSSSGAYTYYRITVSYSDDGGKTFQFLSAVEQRAASGVNGLWEPFLRLANDGSLQCYYSSENSATDQDNLMKRSTDDGATWSSATTVSNGKTSRDGMVGVGPINSGKLIAVFENTEDGPYSIDYVTSTNDGSSWGGRTRLYTARNGQNAGAPQVINVGGTLVVSFMTNEDVAGTNGIDGAQMKVVTSTNGGSSWSASVVTGQAASHWPGLFDLDSTHFLALYSKDGLGAVSQTYTL
ncbi:Uu.00g031680.m01.CDS01 [Anthostomella pinea]|uniref:Uu.00g031680.m01.CDS01 n=1 Tax=Anthostomella pinea TaxID=933095 RepID=A0AAI8V8J9_9PEZI|nr:Uu.00g031680.m01.CDS01 [Anthostomella pinea]